MVIQFLETLCIDHGKPRHLAWHQQRVDATMNHFHPDISEGERSLQLSEILLSCDLPNEGMWRCRIIYGLLSVSIEFIPEADAVFNSLRMMDVAEDFEYLYKYEDRRFLYDLFDKREGADDVLMIRNGWIADTTRANIAFRSGKKWYTPSMPFLAGTTWKRLVASGMLTPRPIHKKHLARYESYKIINALNDWDGDEYPVTGIVE